MSTPPSLTPEQRAAALKKAAEARRVRAEVKAKLKMGLVTFDELLELADRAFAPDPALSSIRGYVDDSGEGRWTVIQAIEESVPAPVLTLSLMMRFHSRQEDSFSAKVIAALRNEFGGHAVKAT